MLAVLLVGCGSEDRLDLPRWNFSGPDSAQQIQVVLPTHVNNLLPRQSVPYWLRVEVELPDRLRGRPLRLVFPCLQAMAEVSVNGTRATEIYGEAVQRYRRAGPQAWRVPATATSGRKLRLEVRVRHTWVKSAWLDEVPYLHIEGETDLRTAVVHRFNEISLTVSIAVLFLIAFTSLVLWLWDRRLLKSGWLAVQLTAPTVLVLFELGATQLLFGVYDTAVAGVTLVAAIISAAYATHAQFKLGRVPWIWPVLQAVTIACAFIFPGPFTAPLYLTLITIFIVAAGLGYQLFLTGRLVRQPHPPVNAWVAFVAWILLASSCSFDMLTWLGLGELLGGLQLKGVGFLIYSVMEFVAISRVTVMARLRADDLNIELQQRIQSSDEARRQIERLNEEMRRQVADRSRQLFAALMLADRRLDKAPRLRPGAIIQQRYRVLRRVATGGMSVVYEALRIADNLPVAIKVPKGLAGHDLARLAREAQVAAQIRHENLVTVYDVDISDAGCFYLALEYVEGKSLSSMKDRFGDVAWALEVLRQVARGLSVMHERGIVHRDLKPGNVLLLEAATGLLVKITDFGISRMGAADKPTSLDTAIAAAKVELTSHEVTSPSSVTASLHSAIAGAAHERQASADDGSGPGGEGSSQSGSGPVITPSEGSPSPSLSPSPGLTGSDSHSRDSDTVTNAGTISGTPSYLAPELLKDPRALNPAIDIYSLGVLAFVLLTGSKPFKVPAIDALALGVALEPPLPLEETLPELGPVVASVLDDCLSFHPVERPTAKEVTDRLGEWLEQRGAAAREAT